MKLSLIILILSLQVFASNALNKPDSAIRVKEQIQEMILGIKGVNGIGITGCNPKTGVKDISAKFVHCVSISTETKVAFAKLRRTYPLGTQIKGVFIWIEYIGRITPQPRMTAGG